MNDAGAIPNERPSTLSRVFLLQYNLILLGGAVSFSLALGSPWPLVLGAVGEFLWLVVGASSPGVRRWLDRRDAFVGESSAPARVAAPVEALGPEYARRVTTLDRALAKVRELGGSRASAGFQRAVARLDSVRPVYFGLCETHQRIGRFLTATTEAFLVAEADRLKAAFAAEKDLGLRLTLKQSLASALRRIEHRQSTLELQRGIAVKLESIERWMAYLVSQGLALPTNSGLLDDVEAMLSEAGPPIAFELEQDGVPVASA